MAVEEELKSTVKSDCAQVVEKRDWAKSMRNYRYWDRRDRLGDRRFRWWSRWRAISDCGLAAGSNLDELVGQIERHRPEVVSVGKAELVDELARRLREKGITPLPEILHGRAGMLMWERTGRRTSCVGGSGRGGA